MGMTIKQRVKVNAALSYIYSEGYDAQAVVAWAKDYMGMGYSPARAYQQALNEFAAGQPDIGVSLGKISRLVEASDVRTVAQYDAALSQFIENGDSTAIDALAPMIAQDAVALAVRSGELPEGALTGEAIETALGFAMADDVITQAATPAATQEAAPAAPQARPEDVRAAQASRPATQRDVFPGFGSAPQAVRPSPTDKQTSPFAAGGRVANPAKHARNGWQGSVGTRTLLQGHRIGGNGISDHPTQTAPTKAEIRANYASAGATFPAETI